ncbi:glycosyltransferase [Clostridium perfringens]
MNYKVSVIIPVYNAQEYIVNCIESLIQQELKEIEFIFINDGSTDNSENLIKQYSKKDSRIKLFNKENQGVSIARNYGLKFCSGEYIGFVDSDDTINPKMYKDLYRIAKNEDLDIIMCSAIIFDKKGNENFEQIKIRKNEKINNISYFPEEFIQVTGSVWKAIYRKELINKNKIEFPTKLPLSEDRIFNIKVLKHANAFMYLDKHYYNYNYNGAVRKYRNNMLEIIIEGKKAQDKCLLEFENSKNLKEVYDKNYIYTIIQCLQNELKRNTSSNFEVIKAIKDILHDKEIIKNINNLENVKWKNKKTKILYKLIKYKQSVLLYFYCIKKMNS